MFRKYNINECIQKIAFLAMTSVETGFFQTAGEAPAATSSSKYFYKGRSLMQLTSHGNDPTIYAEYQKVIGSANNIIANPNLISQKLFLTVDSGGWAWKNVKSLKWNPRARDYRDKDQAEYEAKMKAYEWKRNKFPKGLSKNLNEIALLMKEEEELYFFFICRLLQGYEPVSTSDYPTTLHLDRRKENLQKLKTWFKYDKNVCNSGGIVPELSGRAPWMVLAWIEEAKKLVETGNNKEIQKFFDRTPYEKSMKNNTTNETKISWCATFVNWIITAYGYKGLENYDAVRALSWAKWSEGKELKKPVYGAIAVKTRIGGGHVGFVAGKKGNKIVILGGNQGDTLCCLTYSESDFFSYLVPKDYQIFEEDYNLPEYNGNPGEKGSES
ncbi:TIGR02594 family protein [Flavobacterium piscisymbiosum]|uniref:TIGR02594 family protein n=1 Tax=Flavobacterium piscisymbiosum TaxID=2893753 RepID=A0ABS8MD91_9FLAO|nr:TIGR02594 family protein [Flavobacterium sp. F-30]MCC9063480.1 TIGR02594 family protein [Flavobacterium sp. F-30]